MIPFDWTMSGDIFFKVLYDWKENGFFFFQEIIRRVSKD